MQVSVVLPVRDGRHWIDRAVRSALGQSMADLEVLVVDDGSTDGTPELVRQLARRDPRVRLLSNAAGPHGPGAARNVGLDAAQGRWIAFLDADDAMQPTRLATMLQAAVAHGAQLVADNQRLFTEDGRPRGLLWPDLHRPLPVDAVAWARENCWGGSRPLGYGYAKLLLRRALVEAPRLRFRPELRLMEDFHFVLALLRRGHELLLLPQPLYDYTLRRDSLSRAGSCYDDLLVTLDVGRDVIDSLPPGSRLREAMEAQQASVQLRAVRHQVLRRLRALDMGGAAGLLRRHPGAGPLVLRAVATHLRAKVAA